MEHFSSFQDDEASPHGEARFGAYEPPFMETLETAPSERDLDIAHYLETRIRLLRQDIEGDAPPSDALWHDSVAKDPFYRRYMELRTLKTYGYGIHFVDDAPRAAPGQPSGQRYLTPSLSVYVSQADQAAVRGIMELSYAVDSLPGEERPPSFREFLRLIQGGGGMHAWQADPQQPENRASTADLYLSPQESVLVPDLVERGFMTSRVLYGINGLLHSGDRNQYESGEDRELYERLSRQGYRPLNVEELYGLGAAPVAHVLSEYRHDIPRPASLAR